MNCFLFLWNLFLDHYIQNRRIVNANEQLINCLSRYWPYYFLSKYWENKQHFLSIVSNSKHYDVMALVRSLTLAEWWCRFGAVTFIRQYNSYPALRRQPFLELIQYLVSIHGTTIENALTWSIIMMDTECHHMFEHAIVIINPIYGLCFVQKNNNVRRSI